MATSSPPPSYPTTFPGGQTSSNPPHAYNSITLVRRLILAILVSFAMITTATIIAWQMLQPRVPYFQVDSLSVSNFTLTNSHLTADFRINFTVRNPNRKIDLKLDDFEIEVLYGGKKLAGKTWAHSLYLKKMNETGMSVELGTNSGYGCRIRGKTAIDMSREWSERVVSFRVKMVVWAKFAAGEWLSKQKSVGVCCDKLKVGFFTSNVTAGTLINGRRMCYARLQ